jgi:hypothetical protein
MGGKVWMASDGTRAFAGELAEADRGRRAPCRFPRGAGYLPCTGILLIAAIFFMTTKPVL